MALILDELSYTKEMIKNKNYGKNYVKLKYLVLLAKYFYYVEKNTRSTKKELKYICKNVDKNWNETTQGWKISIAIREAKKRKIRTSIPIPITKYELESIKKVNNYSLEKVLFTLLVYAKILKYNNTSIKPKKTLRLIGTFYVNETLSNIFSVAGLETRRKQRIEMIHTLYSLGYLDATRYGGFLLKYVNEDPPIEFMVETYDDFILYYQRYCGEQIAGCYQCGRLYIKSSTRSGLCHICRQENRRKTWRNAQKKIKLRRLDSTL